MKWFKSKEEKKIDLEKELQKFKEKYSDYFNCYAMHDSKLIIYNEPEIKDGKIVMNYITKNTLEGMQNYSEVWIFELSYGDDFLKTHRMNWLRFKEDCKKLGLKIEKI